MNSLVSFIWSIASGSVRILLRWKILRAVRLPARVISVGNIQAGGSGKTPLVIQIAREAVERGLVTCVLSRGYRSRMENGSAVIAPGEIDLDPFRYGDEPVLIHEAVPGAWIGVGSNRQSSFARVLARLGSPVDLIILDDGFQHWRILKDLELVALTSSSKTEVIYRDFFSALESSDLLIWTKGETKPQFLGKPMVKTHFKISADFKRPLARDQRIWLVTGVADPTSVLNSVKAGGLNVDRHVVFADHAVYLEPAVRKLMSESAAVGALILLTGKDWVKWRKVGIRREEIGLIEMEIDFIEGKELWRQTLWGF